MRLLSLALVLVAVSSVVCAPVTRAPVTRAPVTRAPVELLVDDLVRADERAAEEARSDPLSCAQRAAIPTVEHVMTATWSPDGERLALERIVTIPSAETITGYEEEVRVLELDVYSGRMRDLGESSGPEWSGTGTYLSRWRDGALRITRDGSLVAELEPTTPALRWVSDTLLYWSDEQIRVWTPTADRVLSVVDLSYEPRYPADDVSFSGDGELFTLTRYRMDGSVARAIGETRTGQLAPLDAAGATYTEWAPRGATLLARSAGRIELRGAQGWHRGAALSSFPGPVHGWAPDGKSLLLGAITPTVPGGTSFDRFDVWDGDAVVATATLPNLLGSRSFSPDGRFFVGAQRTSLYGSELALFRCGTAVTAVRADPAARARHARIEADPRRFVRPVTGSISQFLQGRHTGVDIAAPVGSIITAADDGLITQVGWVPVGGRAVCVQHGGGLESCYYHTSIAFVSVGDRVARGAPIAAIGMTGLTSGPHVHWEVKLDGRVVDPLTH